MRIREQQLAALAADARRRFAETMVAHVRHRYPGQCDALADVPTVVDAAIARATGYGLDDEAGIEVFVDLCFEHGLGFEETAEGAADLLRQPDFPGELKIALLRQSFPERDDA